MSSIDDEIVWCALETSAGPKVIFHDQAAAKAALLYSRHFQKLYAYSTCRLFFHLTYASIENPATVLLRTIAKNKTGVHPV